MNNIFDKFFETFGIEKIPYKTPGRTYDGDGELCEWYIEYEYPSIEPVFFELLNILTVQYSYDKTIYCELKDYNMRLNLVQGLLDLYESLDSELKGELRQDVYETFKDYYNVDGIESIPDKEWESNTPTVKVDLTKQLSLQDEQLSIISESIVNRFTMAISYYEDQKKLHPELEGLIELRS